MSWNILYHHVSSMVQMIYSYREASRETKGHQKGGLFTLDWSPSLPFLAGKAASP